MRHILSGQLPSNHAPGDIGGLITTLEQPTLKANASASAAEQATGGVAPEFAKPPLTKIIATVGPASSSTDTLSKLIAAGVSVFRLNFGHGAHEHHAERVAGIRRASAELGRPVAILGDIQGPKMRIGQIAGDGIDLQVGAKIVFQRQSNVGNGNDQPVRLSSNYSRLIDDVEVGHRLLINDAAVRTLIIAKGPDEIECRVITAGRISSNKGINLPDSHVSAQALDEKDWMDVEFAIAHDLDFLALSFVRSGDDVKQLREGVERLTKTVKRCDASRQIDAEFEEIFGQRLSSAQSPMRIIAKIELPEAVKNLDSIIDAADGIMVARGDLGVEMDPARVPVIQKQLMAAADRYGKPCIVATQMLESMIHASAPTRAEANDVACAIMDGADAVMLSGETAVGEYPVLAVASMRRIAQYTEEYLSQQPPKPSAPQKLIESRYRTAALAHGVWTIAQDIQAKFIVVWSQLGGGARYLSQNNFCVPIIAITSDDRAARQMQLYRGVIPLRMPTPEDLAHFTRIVDMYLLETGWAKAGDACVIMAGMPIGQSGVTNSLAVHELGNPQTGFHFQGRSH
jgi:pyruvate kinase